MKNAGANVLAWTLLAMLAIPLLIIVVCCTGEIFMAIYASMQ